MRAAPASVGGAVIRGATRVLFQGRPAPTAVSSGVECVHVVGEASRPGAHPIREPLPNAQTLGRQEREVSMLVSRRNRTTRPDELSLRDMLP
jgi:hypothetical protein